MTTTPAEEKKKFEGILKYPLASKTILDGFKEHKKRKSANPGIDFPCAYGTTVRSAFYGEVTVADDKNDGSGGRIVVVKHGDLELSYMHLSNVCVEVGQKVKVGQVLGTAGGSGFGNDRHYGTHLHFSGRYDGVSFDVEKHLE
jgi:murein DD-endopeptidase MepM/ murein hydrolase activator NlpD